MREHFAAFRRVPGTALVIRLPAAGSAVARTADAMAEIEERAAILEHDAGMLRAEAELVAVRGQNREGDQVANLATCSSADALADRRGNATANLAPACSASTERPPVANLATASSDGAAIVSGSGVKIVAPAVEVSAAEYDRHLEALIAAAGEGTPEASRLAYAKRKGWVVPRGERPIFTRGR